VVLDDVLLVIFSSQVANGAMTNQAMTRKHNLQDIVPVVVDLNLPIGNEFGGTEVWAIKGASEAGVAKGSGLEGSAGGPVLISGRSSGSREGKVLDKESLPKVSMRCEGEDLYDDADSYPDSSSDFSPDAASPNLARVPDSP